MEFTERHHAFISADFYKILKNKFGEKGVNAFILATMKYGEQRGARMAQRAVEDGVPLTFQTYCGYGEWSYTKEFLNRLSNDHIEVISLSPDYVYNVHACPWHDQYKDMGLIEGAVIYCKHLDKAISRGFNPYLTFEVPKTLHDNTHCVFKLIEADLEHKEINKSPHEKLDFDYHCAHIFYTFSAIVKSVFKFEGLKICIDVLSDFADRYGVEYSNRIMNFEHVDFNIVYEANG